MDICRERLAKEGVVLDETLMARLMDVPSVIADCYGAFDEGLKGSMGGVPAGFIAFVKALVAKDIKVVVVSRTDSEAVKAAYSGIESERLVVMHDVSNGFGFCSWDGWRRAARKNDLYERLCVAVAGSGHSVKGALVAGMGVMVKTNPLVEYQDVSGCDVSIGEFSAALTEDVTRILRV